MYDLRTYYYQRYKNNRYVETEAFRGFFVILNLKKRFDYAVITRKTTFIYNDTNKTENEKFDKYFKINMDGKLNESLNSEIIDLIVDFREKYGIEFDVAFKEDMAYMRFFVGDMFEPKVWGNVIDELSLYKYNLIINFLKDLVKIVDVE